MGWFAVKEVERGHLDDLLNLYRMEQKKLICQKVDSQAQDEYKAEKSLLNRKLGKKCTLNF